MSKNTESRLNWEQIEEKLIEYKMLEIDTQS